MNNKEILIKNAILMKIYSINNICNINILRTANKYYINNCKNYENYHTLRYYFAKNKNTDVSIQRILSNDKSAVVRSCLAENPNIHISIQRILANASKKIDVRYSLALNKNVDISIKEILIKDRDYEFCSGIWSALSQNEKNILIDKIGNPSFRREVSIRLSEEPEYI
jgi:hypothetical protein